MKSLILTVFSILGNNTEHEKSCDYKCGIGDFMAAMAEKLERYVSSFRGLI